MRAAMVGGAGYMAGKKIQQGREADANQDSRIDQLEQQQQAAPPPAAAPAAPAAPTGVMSDAAMAQLKQLAELHDQGILTDEEFAAQKQKLLAGG
jgi:hypothetical protein